jgi:23S rRNA (uracil1939-C5)-methyltransferase
MTERLAIARLGHRGDGIADTPEGPIYVPYALPGDIVEVERTPGHPDRRHILRILEPSLDRIGPFCPHFGVCGGCAVQHWAPERYRAWKRGLVTEALSQTGIPAAAGDLIDAHGEGRRRATFHARRGTHDVFEVGFAALRAHHIVAIDRCPVLVPGLAGAIKAAWAVAENLQVMDKPLDIQMTATLTGIDVDIRGSGPLSPAAMGKLATLAGAHGLARLTRHGELIVQRAAPVVKMGRAQMALPPAAFLQATQAGEETLAQLVLDHLPPKAKRIADLFCGVGPFALRIAERAQVTAADSDAAAIAALVRAASGTSGLKPIDAQKRDLFRRPFAGKELAAFDAVVFDPPRQGAEAQARELAASKMPVVIAVSCNPATFARDARILIDGGYRIGAVTPVDQFRHTAHVEIVARFER